MAYMNVEKKRKIAELVKPILHKYGVKGTLSVHHHSTLVLTISRGKLDFIGNYNETGVANRGHWSRGFDPANNSIQVNTHHTDSHYSGKVRDFFNEVIAAMNVDNWDHSDIQSDYFSCGYHISVNVGKWDKPYIFE
jgi:hypothetical protein